ncbi:Small secreted domain [Sinosporangium album]|uniref:Small secreted domain n=1 Tax=Sinosporangium album TaxID=504805 RepID=A0A1G8FC84_9ACTN|nr:chaplin [Sinosporangium album]SDH79662.1 Small secreted domain [Sinosporangium album]
MRKTLQRTAVALGVTGMMFMAAPAAMADHHKTSGRHGILSGNQIFAPITVPVNVCGNSIAILGVAISGCKGGASIFGR